MFSRFTFFISLLFLWPSFVFSFDFKPIFYPVPYQAQGKYITAKKLFPSQSSGFWMQDIKGFIHFFDGKHLLPFTDKNTSFPINKLAKSGSYFWYFEDEQFFRVHSMTAEKEVVKAANLPKKVDRIGSDHDTVWLSNDRFFYTYHRVTQKLTIYSFPKPMSNASPPFAVNDAKIVNGVWFIATNQGVLTSSDSNKLLQDNQFSEGAIEYLYYSISRNELVLGGTKGAWILDLTSEEIVQLPLKHQHVLTITETPAEYWFGTDNGLYKHPFLSGDIIELHANFRDNYSIEGNRVYDLFSDGRGGMWISTDNGISYYSVMSTLFSRIRYGVDYDNLQTNQINSILQTPNQVIWAATDTGLSQLKLDPIKVETSVIGEDEIFDLAMVGEQLWLGVSSGLKVFNWRTEFFESIELPLALQGKKITHVVSDQHGSLWLSSETGVMRYWPENNKLIEFGFYWQIEKDASSRITHLYSDSYGTVWFGTDHGLYAYRNGKIAYETSKASYQGSMVDMASANQEFLWFVNNHGLQIAQGIDTENKSNVQLVEENITPQCVVPTQRGVWLSSSKGLSFYQADGTFLKHFGAPFGLVNNEFIPDLCVKGDGDTLIFGSQFGLIIVNEVDLLIAETPASNVIISEVRINHKLKKLAVHQEKKTLIPYKASLSFQFGVLPEFDFDVLEYRLLGSNDEEWSNFQGGFLVFEHLAPGNYMLEVKDQDIGQQLRPISQFRFYVAQPWYMAPWFIVLVVLIFLSFLFVIMSWRSRYMRKANALLKEAVTLKTHQLNRQSKALVSSNRQLQKLLTIRQHVINQFADDITTPIVELKERINVHTPLSDYKATILQNTDYVLQMIEQFKLLEPGPVNIETDQVDALLSPIVQATVKGWQLDAESKGATIVVDDQAKGFSVSAQPYSLDVILNNLIAGAIKRVITSDSIIKLSVKVSGEFIDLSIQDFGSLLTEQYCSELELVTSSSANQQSVLLGIGLLNAKQLVLQNQGVFRLASNDAVSGVCIIIRWPIANYVSYDQQGTAVLDPSAPVRTTSEPTDESVHEDPWLEKVYHLVEQHYHLPEFGTSAAAKLLFISERSLQRKFKQLAGRSFKDYVIEFRLEQACSRLMKGGKVSDVAFDCGFNDPSYFSQRFKLHYGLSPTKFMEGTD